MIFEAACQGVVATIVALSMELYFRNSRMTAEHVHEFVDGYFK